MLLWDLGGQRNLRQIWTKYYSDADALIFVFDAGSSEERLKEARDCFGKYPICCLKVLNRNNNYH